MRLIGPLVLAVLGAGFILILIRAHEPSLPVTSRVGLIDLSLALPADLKAKSTSPLLAGIMPSVNRTLHFWTLAQRDEQSSLLVQRLDINDAVERPKATPNLLLSLSSPQTPLMQQHMRPIVNDTFEGSTKYILTDDAGSRLPTVTLITSQIVEEDLTYRARVYALEEPTHGPEVSFNESFRFVNGRVPGSLGFTRLSYGNPNTLVYARKQDKTLFRVLRGLEPMASHSSKDGQPAVSEASIAGPLLSQFPGRVLSLLPLYTKDPADIAIFGFQYTPMRNGKLFTITISIFSKPSGKTWSRHVLWETVWHGVGENTIMADETDLLYFLTNPVVVTSRFSRNVAFAFMKSIFTLDFVGDDVPDIASGAHVACGYTLSRLGIDQISGNDLELNNMHIDSRGTTLIASNEHNRLFVFERRQQRPNLPPMTTARKLKNFVASWASNLESVLASSETWQLLMDIFWGSSDEVQLSNLDDDKTPQSSPLFTAWDLTASWSVRDDLATSSRKIEALTLLEHPTRDLTVVLLDKSDLVVLDHHQHVKEPYAVRFVQKNIVLVLALTFVVIVFVLNEFKPDDINRSNRLIVILLYSFGFFVMLSVMVAEAQSWASLVTSSERSAEL
ncbi:hypothetical protein BC831DRAFT_473627 [Entophlyctis helioformis]|nr:hypothetical protein BC831DRAFT_473627 [Entophlyctis helioformis]